MTSPPQHILSKDHRSFHLCNGSSCCLPDIALNLAWTLSVAARHKDDPFRRSMSSSCDFRAKLICGIDGHRSLSSDDSSRRVTKAHSAPITPSTAHDHKCSEALDRKLRAIDEALRQESDAGARRGRMRRLYASEVSRRENSQAVEDDAAAASNVLIAWRNAQLKELSQRCGVLFPSPAASEMPSPSQLTCEVCTMYPS